MIADDMQQNLERYLSGAMSPEESRSFLARADSDMELRRLMEADRIISGAVARDRVATMPASMPASTTPGVALMAALEMSRSVVHPLVSSWMGLKVAAIGVAIGLAGLVAGSLVVVPMIEGSTAPAVSAPGVIAPESPADPIGVDEEESSNALDADARGDESLASPSADDRATSAADRAVVNRGSRAGRPAGRTAPGTEKPATTATTTTAADIDERAPESLPQVDEETIPLNVDLEQKK